MPKDSVIKTGKEAKWVEMQIVGLTSWINSFLTRRDASSEIKDLEKDLCDGVRLGDFLEIASFDFQFIVSVLLFSKWIVLLVLHSAATDTRH